MSRITRLQTEKRDIEEAFQLEEMDAIIKLQPFPSKQFDTWIMKFAGKQGTDLYPGYYEVEMVMPATYPANFPVCTFKNGFSHYHIYQSGAICLPMLKTGGWSPANNLIQLSKNIVNMVHSDPVVDDHADTKMKDMYKADKGPENYRKHLQAQAQKFSQYK